MNISTVGIDLAKNVFQLHGVNEKGKKVLKERLSRAKFSSFMQQLPVCRVVMESCGSSHYWSRRFQAMGHEVKLIAPQFVKPFTMGNKTDANDARAICQASLCEDMRYVPVKSIEQQDIQCIHRHRRLLVKQRTELVNQIRGLLAEYGVIIPKQIRFVRNQLPGIIDDTSNELTPYTRGLFSEMYEELKDKDTKIKGYDIQLDSIAKEHPVCQNLLSIPGVGSQTATALYAAVGFAHEFKNGRQFAAWCGLVPKQFSSGETVRLGGISKRGNPELRTLLVHGARSLMRSLSKSDTAKARWMKAKQARSSTNRTLIALANKQARIAWVMLSQGVCYSEDLANACGSR